MVRLCLNFYNKIRLSLHYTIFYKNQTLENLDMKKTQWLWIGLIIPILIVLTNLPVKSENIIDTNATQILQSMSSYLGETQAFTVNTDINLEIVTANNQKLQFNSFGTIALARPDKFHIRRQGVVADIDFFFDGETLTLQGNRSNVYAQLNVSGTIDDAIRAFELETGIPAPGADLLFNDVYSILSEGVENSVYLGTAYVNGIECHHLAFREADVDWQLWVQVGDTPLPMKYVITNKWVTAAPQYTISLRDWNTNPELDAQQFIFVAPEGFEPLETIPTDELEEFQSTQEER
ncbi:MAG: DUF2092 domain-containing protein [Gloeocapsa sp. DLM2.Bin57]|nr:MAG: DUF2092 domain-containing protein [Gloeocapsa sp. DLM2.Bin57]